MLRRLHQGGNTGRGRDAGELLNMYEECAYNYLIDFKQICLSNTQGRQTFPYFYLLLPLLGDVEFSIYINYKIYNNMIDSVAYL